MPAVIGFSPPQDARFCAFSRRNVHFKKSVKYNVRTAINHKAAPGGPGSAADALEIATLEQ
jgi:hypothetical protein